jgi:hypothetical protein
MGFELSTFVEDVLLDIFLVSTASFELEHGVLWNQLPSRAGEDVVDLWGRFGVLGGVVSALFGRAFFNILFLSQLLPEVTICFESYQTFQAGELVRNNALM